jgi:hypothetical protein
MYPKLPVHMLRNCYPNMWSLVIIRTPTFCNCLADIECGIIWTGNFGYILIVTNVWITQQTFKQFYLVKKAFDQNYSGFWIKITFIRYDQSRKVGMSNNIRRPQVVQKKQIHKQNVNKCLVFEDWCSQVILIQKRDVKIIFTKLKSMLFYWTFIS